MDVVEAAQIASGERVGSTLWRRNDTTTNGRTVTTFTWHRMKDAPQDGAAVERAAQFNEMMTGQERQQPIIAVIGTRLKADRVGTINEGVILVDRRAERPGETAWVAAHETAHLWWSEGAAWVTEGIAELTAEIATGGKTPEGLGVECPWETLTAWLDAGANNHHECSLKLGHQTLREAWQREPERTQSALVAFRESQAEDKAKIANQIADRWGSVR